jgi:hypothetical protein
MSNGKSPKKIEFLYDDLEGAEAKIASEKEAVAKDKNQQKNAFKHTILYFLRLVNSNNLPSFL